MTYQATRQRHPTKQEIRNFHNWCAERIWLYDQHGTIDPKIIFAVIRYAVDVFEIEHVVIDSLMKCGLSESKDFDGVKSFVDELTTLAKDLNIHIHLVAHSRKGSSDGGDPDHYLSLRIASEAIDDSKLPVDYDHTSTGVVVGRGTYFNRGFGTVFQHGIIVDQTI